MRKRYTHSYLFATLRKDNRKTNVHNIFHALENPGLSNWGVRTPLTLRPISYYLCKVYCDSAWKLSGWMTSWIRYMNRSKSWMIALVSPKFTLARWHDWIRCFMDILATSLDEVLCRYDSPWKEAVLCRYNNDITRTFLYDSQSRVELQRSSRTHHLAIKRFV